MPTHTDAERRLLEEGIASYVQVFSAVLAFRTIVETRIRRSLEERLPEYVAALDVSLDKGQMLSFHTSTTDWDGTCASLGVEMRNLGAARSWLYHTMYWELKDDGSWITKVGSSIWVRKRFQVEELRKAFQPHPTNMTFSDADKEIWLYEPIVPGDAANIDEKLDSTLDSWIKLWKRVGGLKVLSDDAAADD